jgi:hypothetical protein
MVAPATASLSSVMLVVLRVVYRSILGESLIAVGQCKSCKH